MARSDLLLSLVRAGAMGDQILFRKTVEAMAAEERAKQHHVLADRLLENVRSLPNNTQALHPVVGEQLQGLFYEIVPRRSLQDLILPEAVLTACQELLEEQLRMDLLRSYNLEPRHRVLLVGPPGNGKTALAEALAEGLTIPLIQVRYEGIIGSYLGETSQRLKRLFDYVRTRRCLLFFDEFDALGKERGDIHETGEIKRVVSSLLMQIDDLPSHVVVVTATNHPELLDRAVWRRFQIRLTLPAPSPKALEEWFRRFEARIGKPLGFAPRILAEKLKGLSFAEVEEFCMDVQRRYVLSLPQEDLKPIVAERLKQWKLRYNPPAAEQGAKKDGKKKTSAGTEVNKYFAK
ncbi:AAA ATPase central domain protein [Desulfofundulus kuznetsovii DSM 6115]|uniref:AAA ATPase central domain protein n=1 Tax=Desulfofundulus kuznetsovii (strain DSM 6115 / VKM B-1805 / 17) TaxID=760568 RepID=A0AAU8PG59_DESK7|nr:AAA ATPase central domain protein [Desulfofundulus kuznetsovii DSM 6115]